MVIALTGPSTMPRIKAWLKVGVCFIGYFAVLEVIEMFETRHLLTYNAARLAMLGFTAVSLFLLVAYATTLRSNPKSLIKAWINVALCVLGYCAAYYVVKWMVSAHALAPVRAQALLMVFVYIMLLMMLVITFRPFKKYETHS
jgi:hypothetical protein